MEVKRHDIIQINENHKWIGCLAYVTEVRSWGVQAFIQVPEEGRAFIRLKYGEFDIIGEASLQIDVE